MTQDSSQLKPFTTVSVMLLTYINVRDCYISLIKATTDEVAVRILTQTHECIRAHAYKTRLISLFLPRNTMRKCGLCCGLVYVRPSVMFVHSIQTSLLAR